MFGLAGFVLPSEEVRSFGTWFFQRKCELLDFEIKRAGTHPARWEKKGASLYTATNVAQYPELRRFTNRLFNRVNASGGFVFYVGITKRTAPVRPVHAAHAILPRSTRSRESRHEAKGKEFFSSLLVLFSIRFADVSSKFPHAWLLDTLIHGDLKCHLTSFCGIVENHWCVIRKFVKIQDLTAVVPNRQV